MKMLNVISLGAGVQSSTMALMAAHGEITPMPDCAIFADTQAEPKRVMDYLEMLKEAIPFPVHVVSAGNLFDQVMKNKTLSGHDFQDVPWRTIGGMGRRQCTTQYKINPLYKKIRELGASAKNPVNFWVGISLDEAHRAKPSRVKYLQNWFPLLENRINRLDCLRWIKKHGYMTPPKSSCVFCPYKGRAEWAELNQDDLARAIIVDEQIRTFGIEQYAHRDLKPLRDVDLRTVEQAGQDDMFGEECEGMCGV